MRHLTLIACMAALSAASCSAPMMMTVDECPEVIAESWSIIHWSMSDGTTGSTGCHGPIQQFATLSTSTGRTEMWGGENSAYAEPADMRVPPRVVPIETLAGPGTSFTFQNYPTATGTTGAVGIDRYPPSATATALTPHFFLWLGGCPRDQPTCDVATQSEILHPRPGGTFEFAVGGTWGDIVELVVHDVTWDLASGESFTIDEGTWHYRLPAAPEPPRVPVRYA